MKTKHTHIAALTCASLLGSAALSQAALTVGQLVSVNFGTAASADVSGAAVLGLSGDTWTNIKDGGQITEVATPYGLNLTTGGASGVSFQLTGGYGFNEGDNTGSTAAVFQSGLMKIGGFGGGNSNILLTGLSVDTQYFLYLYAASGLATGEGAAFTFEGNTQSTTDAIGAESSYAEGVNYVKYTLTSDAGGNISGTWNDNGATTRFNGLQIAAVPEPSAALLGGLGMLCLLRRRRA